MSLQVDIISVGALSRNRFWDEPGQVRASHATTTLIRDDEKTILVDPSLPGEVLAQRLDERTGLKPTAIDTVFLTNFRPIHRRGLDIFNEATWLVGEAEREAMLDHLNTILVAADARGEEPDELVEQEQALLGRCEIAPERLTEQVHLFPTPGVTPGAASLLVLSPERTLVVAGDAVINRDYFAHRRAFEQHADAEAAVRSISEILEVADMIIPGHGDWIFDL